MDAEREAVEKQLDAITARLQGLVQAQSSLQGKLSSDLQAIGNSDRPTAELESRLDTALETMSADVDGPRRSDAGGDQTIDAKGQTENMLKEINGALNDHVEEMERSLKQSNDMEVKLQEILQVHRTIDEMHKRRIELVAQ